MHIVSLKCAEVEFLVRGLDIILHDWGARSSEHCQPQVLVGPQSLDKNSVF